MQVEVIAALVALVTSLLTAVVTTLGTIRWEREKLRTEMRTEFMAEAAVRQLLQHEHWRKRSFARIKKHLGGFTDDELRRILVGAGAVRFEGEEGEMWGLRERNPDALD